MGRRGLLHDCHADSYFKARIMVTFYTLTGVQLYTSSPTFVCNFIGSRQFYPQVTGNSLSARSKFLFIIANYCNRCSGASQYKTCIIAEQEDISIDCFTLL